MPADRGRYPSPAVALPSPPAACLVPGLPLPQARRSREITPPDRLWLNARRPASVSKPAGLPLTQAHWIGVDSCLLAAAIPSPVDQVHMSRPGVPCVFCRAHRNILTTMSCLVHGDSSGAAPLLLKWRRSLRDPVRAPDSWSCPEEASASELAHEGFWFLWDVLSCLSGPGGLSCHCGMSCLVCRTLLSSCPVLSVWPWRAVLSCFVLSCLFNPGGLLIPPHFPMEIFGGVVGFRL